MHKNHFYDDESSEGSYCRDDFCLGCGDKNFRFSNIQGLCAECADFSYQDDDEWVSPHDSSNRDLGIEIVPGRDFGSSI